MTQPHEPQPRWLAWSLLATLLAATGDWTIGGLVSTTGERLEGGLPVGTLVLAAGLALGVGLAWRERRLPRLGWPHLLLLAALPLGILGMTLTELPVALRELAQLGEILLAAWLLFQLADRATLIRLAPWLAGLAVLLLILGRGVSWTSPYWQPSIARYGTLLLLTVPFLLVAIWERCGAMAWLPAGAALCLAIWRTQHAGLAIGLGASALLTAWLWQPRRACQLGAAFLLAIVPMTMLAPPSVSDPLRAQFDGGHPRRGLIETQAAFLAPRHYPLGGGLGQYKPTINVLRQHLAATPHPADHKVPPESNSQFLVTLVEAGLPAALLLIVVFLDSFHQASRGAAGRPADDRAPEVAVAGAVAGLAFAAIFCNLFTRGLGIWAGAVLGLASRRRQASGGGLPFMALLAPAAIVLACMGLAARFNASPAVDRVSRLQAEARRLLTDAPPPSRAPEIVSLSGETTAERNVIRIEGEAFNEATHPFRAIPHNDASGNRALSIPQNAGNGTGVARYRCLIPEAGRYRLRARIYWLDGCSNSLAFSLAGKRLTLADETFNAWHTRWALPDTGIDLPAGELAIEAINLEDGIRLDWFELVPAVGP